MMVHSTLCCHSDHDIKVMDAKKAELEIAPPIDFWTMPDEEEDDDKYDKIKDLYVSIKVPLDLTKVGEDKYETYTAKVKVFKTVLPCAWNAVATTLFQHAKEVNKIQKCYLREGGLKFCGPYAEPRQFYERLELIIGYIEFFPIMTCKNQDLVEGPRLDGEDKIGILEKAHPTSLPKLILANGVKTCKYDDPDKYVRDLQDWYGNLQLSYSLDNYNKNNKGSRKCKNGVRRTTRAVKGKEPKKPCKHCGNVQHHNSDDSDTEADNYAARTAPHLQQDNSDESVITVGSSSSSDDEVSSTSTQKPENEQRPFEIGAFQ